MFEAAENTLRANSDASCNICSVTNVRHDVATSNLHSKQVRSPLHVDRIRHRSVVRSRALEERPEPDGASQSFLEAAKMATKQSVSKTTATGAKGSKRKSRDTSDQSFDREMKRAKRKRRNDVIADDEDKENNPQVRSQPMAKNVRGSDVTTLMNCDNRSMLDASHSRMLKRRFRDFNATDARRHPHLALL